MSENDVYVIFVEVSMSGVPRWMKKKENRPIVLILSIILICGIFSIISLISSGFGMTTIVCFFITFMQIFLLVPMLFIALARNLKMKDANLKRRGFDPGRKDDNFKPGPLLSGLYWIKERRKWVILFLLPILILGFISVAFIDVNIFGLILVIFIFICAISFLLIIFMLSYSMEEVQEKTLDPSERILYLCNSCDSWTPVDPIEGPIELECSSCGMHHELPDPKEVKGPGKEYQRVLCPICKSALVMNRPVKGPIICHCGVEIFDP